MPLPVEGRIESVPVTVTVSWMAVPARTPAPLASALSPTFLIEVVTVGVTFVTVSVSQPLLAAAYGDPTAGV